MCSQLLDMWSVRMRRTGRRAMELTAYPQTLQGGYHRVTGLHYMSSFSDAEDCCDDTSSGSSVTTDWQTPAADGWQLAKHIWISDEIMDKRAINGVIGCAVFFCAEIISSGGRRINNIYLYTDIYNLCKSSNYDICINVFVFVLYASLQLRFVSPLLHFFVNKNTINLPLMLAFLLMIQ